MSNVGIVIGIFAGLSLMILNARAFEPPNYHLNNIKNINKIAGQIVEIKKKQLLYNNSCQINVFTGKPFLKDDQIFKFFEKSKYGKQEYCFESEAFQRHLNNSKINPLTGTNLTESTLAHFKEFYEDE